MTRTIITALFASLVSLGGAVAQQSPAAPPAQVDEIIRNTFSRAPAEWRQRIELDETQRICTETRNQVSGAQADAIQARETATVVVPPDNQLLGDWQRGFEIANNGRGGQFSDGPSTVPGGNCYACHQMDPKELSFGTLGPSLAGYGRERNFDPALMRDAFIKIFNAQAVVACSNMPRFGTSKFLTPDQIRDVLAYLFDRNSPVNK